MKNFTSRIIDLLKAHFFAGVLVLIPFLVITWLLGAVVGMAWRLQWIFLPVEWLPRDNPAGSLLIQISVTVGTCLILALATSLLGWTSKNYFGRKILEFIADVISRIPVIRSIYGALDQLLKTISAGDGQQFNRVVYVEYPRKGLWTLAFVTGPTRSTALPDRHLNIFVPTTPNPTGGFYLIVPESEIRESHLRVEEAFRIILSLGIAQGMPEHLESKGRSR